MIYKSALSTSEIVDLSRYHLLKDNSHEKIFFKLRPESISERLGISAHLLGVSHYDMDLQGNANEEQEGEREVIFVPEDNADLDMSQIIYDYVCLSLPMQRCHEEGECNPEAMKYYGGEAAETVKDDVANPFSALKNMFEA